MISQDPVRPVVTRADSDSTRLLMCLHEWETRDPDRTPDLRWVFLPDDPATHKTVKYLNERNMLRLTERKDGLAVEATSYVGKVKLGRLTITIQPKIHGAPLMRLLRYAYGLRDVQRFSMSTYAAESFSFQDILICQLASEASELITRGLRREYVRRKEPLSSPRGRVDVGRLAQTGGVAGAALPCVHYMRLDDAPLNQALLAGLDMARTMTDDLVLHGDLISPMRALRQSVSYRRLDRTLLSQARRALSRLTRAYEPAITLIQLLYDQKGISLDDGERIALPGFLFDMNRFFQALLSRFLAEHLTDYTLIDECSFRDTFAYADGYNPRGRRAPRLRPDYLVRQTGHTVAILDAKYRDLWETELPTEWLYQLTIYALSQPSPRSAAILYPSLDPAATEARIEMHDPADGDLLATVSLRPVDLNRLDTLLLSRSGANLRDCVDFARTLAGLP